MIILHTCFPSPFLDSGNHDSALNFVRSRTLGSTSKCDHVIFVFLCWDFLFNLMTSSLIPVVANSIILLCVHVCVCPCMWGPNLLCLFISWWPFFPVFSQNSADINIVMQTSICHTDFIFFGYIPSSVELLSQMVDLFLTCCGISSCFWYCLY